MTLRKPEFPLFPHSLWRPNPNFLASGNLPAGTVDPWARRDDWRYHKFFSAKNRLKATFPGKRRPGVRGDFKYPTFK